MTTAPASSQVAVAVRLIISEGVRTVVDGVTFTGNQALSESALNAAVGLQPGVPFVPGQLAVDREAILVKYESAGYQSATVEARPEFSQNDTHVAVQFTIREGPRIVVGHVLIM